MSDKNFLILKFLTQRTCLISKSKTILYCLKKGRIAAMDKGKGIQAKPSEKKRITRKKQRRKRLYELLFFLESPEEEINEKSYEEECYEELLARQPSFEGRLANADNKISLEAYPHEGRKKIEVIYCTLIF